MFKKTIYILLFVLFCGIFTTNAFSADSYRFEGSGVYDYTTYDEGEINLYALQAIAYLNEVSLGNTPYEYVAFYNKASYLGIQGFLGNIDEDDFEFNFKSISPKIHYVIPTVPIFVGISYQYLLMEGDYDYKSTLNAIDFELGYYIMDGLAISAMYKYGKDTLEEMEFGIFTIPETETISNKYGANVQYVTMLNDQMGIHLNAFYTHENVKEEEEDALENSIFSVVGDFYFTPKIGLGGGVEINTGDDESYTGNTYSARGSIFFTPNIALSIEYLMYKADNTDESEDSNEIQIMLTGRI